MSNSGLQQQRNDSRSCNEDILLDIGFRRVGNLSLYRKVVDAYILSPGISKGKHKKYWFDIREANLQKITNNTETMILLRWLCRDICNGFKHKKLSKPTYDPDFNIYRAYDHFFVETSESTNPLTINFAFSYRDNIKIYKMFDLLNKCYNIWKEFLKNKQMLTG